MISDAFSNVNIKYVHRYYFISIKIKKKERLQPRATGLFRALFMKCELIKSELPWQLNLTNNEKFRTRARKNWSNRRQRDLNMVEWLFIKAIQRARIS